MTSGGRFVDWAKQQVVRARDRIAPLQEDEEGECLQRKRRTRHLCVIGAEPRPLAPHVSNVMAAAHTVLGPAFAVNVFDKPAQDILGPGCLCTLGLTDASGQVEVALWPLRAGVHEEFFAAFDVNVLDPEEQEGRGDLERPVACQGRDEQPQHVHGGGPRADHRLSIQLAEEDTIVGNPSLFRTENLGHAGGGQHRAQAFLRVVLLALPKVGDVSEERPKERNRRDGVPRFAHVLPGEVGQRLPH